MFSGLEPRIVTRWDIHAYARKAYDIGIRYIGGCCGFEAYHIRAISEEVWMSVFAVQTETMIIVVLVVIIIYNSII